MYKISGKNCLESRTKRQKNTKKVEKKVVGDRTRSCRKRIEVIQQRN